MPQGRIKTLVSDRGFGFINTGHGGLFFHMSAVQETTFEQPHEGQWVEYGREADTQKLFCAICVKPVSSSDKSNSATQRDVRMQTGTFRPHSNWSPQTVCDPCLVNSTAAWMGFSWHKSSGQFGSETLQTITGEKN